ncbi:MAG: chromate efflux transporter, partial [Chloroflexi bacterium]
MRTITDQDLKKPGAPPVTTAALREVIRVFLPMGLLAFGGPAAHIGLFRAELVDRRRWISDEEFLDLLGITNLVPGPNSTEMAIHLGYRRAGMPGLVAAGVCFILPAALITLGLAWLYTRYGSTPQAEGLLYGIRPVMIAIVALAIWTLGRKAVQDWLTGAVAGAALILFAFNLHELLVLFGGGLAVLLARELRNSPRQSLNGLLVGLALNSGWAQATAAAGALAAAQPFSLGVLFLTFFKIGATLYGSGYVLLAFLRADFVERLGWLTEGQLLDSIIIGQATPGPVFSTATFVGYLVGGAPGAALATVGIFLPAFAFVAATSPFVHQIRSGRRTGALLDGINAAALGLMA